MRTLFTHLHVALLSCHLGAIAKGPTRKANKATQDEGFGFGLFSGRENRAPKATNPGSSQKRR